MKKRNMMKAIEILRAANSRKSEEIAEYREILSGIEGSLDDLPYWELASGILEIDEQRVTDQFQWFRSWMIRNGLTEALKPPVDLFADHPSDKPRLDGHHDGEGYRELR